MDWLTPARRAALERLDEIQRPVAIAGHPRSSVVFEDHRAGSPFTFSEDGRRHTLGPGVATLFKADWIADPGIGEQPVALRRFGRLQRLALHSLWLDDRSFTSWLGLEDTVDLLGKTLGLHFTRVQFEVPGADVAGIVLREQTTGRLVVVGGSPHRTDAKPLADLLARAADVRARAVIWIAGTFTKEQRRSLSWLDSVTGTTTRFAGLRLEVWCIDESPPAARFTRIYDDGLLSS